MEAGLFSIVYEVPLHTAFDITRPSSYYDLNTIKMDVKSQVIHRHNILGNAPNERVIGINKGSFSLFCP